MMSSISALFPSFSGRSLPWLSPRPLLFITFSPIRITASFTASSPASDLSWYQSEHRSFCILFSTGVLGRGHDERCGGVTGVACWWKEAGIEELKDEVGWLRDEEAEGL